MSRKDKQRDTLRQAAERYHKALLASEHGTSYLASRGIVANKTTLGYVDSPITGHDEYKGMLSIPYYAPDGSVVTIRFRCLKGHTCTDHGHSRYNDLPGKKVRMYNTSDLLTAGNVVAICEGELDAIVLSQQCGINAVGVSGIDAWYRHYPRVFEDYEHTLIFGDGDQDGKRFTDNIARQLDNGVPIAMPAGMDVSELFVEQGSEGITNLFKELV